MQKTLYMYMYRIRTVIEHWSMEVPTSIERVNDHYITMLDDYRKHFVRN